MAAYVPIDLHRHRSVVMHMAVDGEVLGWTCLANDPETLVAEVLKAGEAPEVAIEATYGWYWAVDALQAAGANVHLVAPSKVGVFGGRRVKNDQRDCQLLGDLSRANMLPEAWISTLEVREWRELVRYRSQARRTARRTQSASPRGAGQAWRARPDDRLVRCRRPSTARSPVRDRHLVPFRVRATHRVAARADRRVQRPDHRAEHLDRRTAR